MSSSRGIPPNRRARPGDRRPLRRGRVRRACVGVCARALDRAATSDCQPHAQDLRRPGARRRDSFRLGARQRAVSARAQRRSPRRADRGFGQAAAPAPRPCRRVRASAIVTGRTAMEIVTQLDGAHRLGVVGWVGADVPLHASAAGKLVLAELSQSELEAWFEEARPVRLTARTVTTFSGLAAELRRVRRRGWAEIVDELEDGLMSLSAPIRDRADISSQPLASAGRALVSVPPDLPSWCRSCSRLRLRSSRRLILARCRRERVRGAIFHKDAAGYAAGRPGYSQEIFAALEERCGLGEGTRVIEIGPGTGQATGELLRRGAHVHAVEPGPALARHLLTEYPGERLEVTVSSFEDSVLPEAGADLVVAATSFHWVEPEIGAPKALSVPEARRLDCDLVEPLRRPAHAGRVQSRARPDLRGVRRCREPRTSSTPDRRSTGFRSCGRQASTRWSPNAFPGRSIRPRRTSSRCSARSPTCGCGRRISGRGALPDRRRGRRPVRRSPATHVSGRALHRAARPSG